MDIVGKVVEQFSDIFEFEKNPADGKNGIAEIEFSKMKPFPGHIFKLYKGQQLEDMIESIKQLGTVYRICRRMAISSQSNLSHIFGIRVITTP